MNIAGAQKLAVTAGVLALAGLVIYVWYRGPGGVAKDATKAAVNVATGAIEGTVKGVGEAVGIPDTDLAKCHAALAAGDYWEASFVCPVSEFAKGVLFESQQSVQLRSGAASAMAARIGGGG